jgi:hypothetical protein
MIANIALDDALILPHRANPTGLNFRERQCGSALETDRLALARFLMITGRPQTRLGFWFLTFPRISVLEYK